MNSEEVSAKVNDLATNVERLTIEEPPTDGPKESVLDPNPWAEQDELANLVHNSITTPDPAVLAKAVAPEQDLEMPPHEANSKVHVNEDVLHEFDPLAVPEEKEARDAWSQAESHPPPSSPGSVEQSTVPTEKPEPALPATPPRPTSSSAFPSLASLARSFALPRQRPRSIDSPPSVLSPASLSTFASQQRIKPMDERETSADAPSSGNALPQSGKEREDDKAPVFDFQKFLDQMKLKSAEPVAKYLRSYV